MLDTKLLVFSALTVLQINLAWAQSDTDPRFASNRFIELKQLVFSQSYNQLPRYKVKKSQFRSSGKQSQNLLFRDAKRTLTDTRDLLESGRGQKLLQANGICFAGEWQIDQASDYTGLFSNGKLVPVLARASVAFSGTRQAERRVFGIALKLMPSNLVQAPSLNVFMLHSLGGTKTKYIRDLSLDNQPSLGRIPRFGDISTALRMRRDLESADRDAGSIKPSATFRTVAHLAAYRTKVPFSPKWLKLTPADETRVNKDDFRDELRVEHYPNQQLRYAIEVGQQNDGKKNQTHWQRIGQLVFTESITSEICDKRLHFSHPLN